MINMFIGMGIEQITNGIAEKNEEYIMNGLYNLCVNGKKTNSELKGLLLDKYDKMREVLIEIFEEAIENDDIDWLDDYVLEIIK